MQNGVEVFDTGGLLDGEARAAWHEIVCRSFVPLECRPREERFSGRITRLPLGAHSLSQVRAGAQSVTRTRRLISAADEAYFLLSLGVSGTGQVVQDGREATIAPGSLALYHSCRPYTLRFDGHFEQLVLMMPAAELQARFGEAEFCTALRIDQSNPLATLTAGFLSGLLQGAREVPGMLAPRLAAQAAELVATMLIAAGPRSGATTSHRLAMGLQIRNAIAHRLRDPRLNRQFLAKEFRITTRYLDDLFSDGGEGVAEYILKRRLEWARDALRDPSRQRFQIGEIARMSGFVSQSHFSRAFAAAFSCSPRELRNETRRASAAERLQDVRDRHVFVPVQTRRRTAAL